MEDLDPLKKVEAFNKNPTNYTFNQIPTEYRHTIDFSKVNLKDKNLMNAVKNTHYVTTSPNFRLFLERLYKSEFKDILSFFLQFQKFMRDADFYKIANLPKLKQIYEVFETTYRRKFKNDWNVRELSV